MRGMLVVGLTALASVGCNTAPPPFRPVSDVKELMQRVLDPNAETVWDAVGTIVTAAGTEELEPHTEEDWEAVRRSALTLAESGNLLMMSPRARDADDWMEMSQALIDASLVSLRAASAKDKKALFDSGEGLYNACANCHDKYSNIPRR